MEIVLAAVVAAVVSAAVVLVTMRTRGGRLAPIGPRIDGGASEPLSEGVGVSGDDESESELHARRAEIARIEERLLSKQEALDLRLAELTRKEQSLEDRARNLDRDAEKLKASKQDHLRELER